MSLSSSFTEYLATYRRKHPALGCVPDGWIAAGYEDELIDKDEYNGDTLVLPLVDMSDVPDYKPFADDSEPDKVKLVKAQIE